MSAKELTSRRVFLRRGLTLVASAGAVPVSRARSARAVGPAGAGGGGLRRRVPNDHILVIVELVGGNDGLNTVIPVRNDLYYAYRPGLGIERRAALQIDDTHSFHPALRGLKALYDQGLLAIVQGVGYPNPTRSHIRSMQVWHTASPDGALAGDWISRCFDSACQCERRRGPHAGTALMPAAALKMGGGEFGPIGLQHAQHLPVRAASCASLPLAAALRAVGRAITSRVPARIYRVSQGGYDTHCGQAIRHGHLLTGLGGALKLLVDDLRAAGQLDRVAIMTVSEFGRRVEENATGGTDHGEAGPMFVMGGQIRPGIYGRGPRLDRDQLHRGDLAWTTDFRRVYAAALKDWLAADADSILGEAFEALPIFRRRSGGFLL